MKDMAKILINMAENQSKGKMRVPEA